jgi:hypothetical protein
MIVVDRAFFETYIDQSPPLLATSYKCIPAVLLDDSDREQSKPCSNKGHGNISDSFRLDGNGRGICPDDIVG